MRSLKTFRRGLMALVLFVGIAGVFSVPGLVRCGGEVDPEGSSAVSTI